MLYIFKSPAAQERLEIILIHWSGVQKHFLFLSYLKTVELINLLFLWKLWYVYLFFDK